MLEAMCQNEESNLQLTRKSLLIWIRMKSDTTQCWILSKNNKFEKTKFDRLKKVKVNKAQSMWSKLYEKNSHLESITEILVFSIKRQKISLQIDQTLLTLIKVLVKIFLITHRLSNLQESHHRQEILISDLKLITDQTLKIWMKDLRMKIWSKKKN